MTGDNHIDVIIIGGSYSGFAAGMALGRALRKILIIDDGKPCNRQTPYSHNFLTNDGKVPGEITARAKQELSKYDTVTFFNGRAISADKTAQGFKIQVASGETFAATKLIFATGIKDLLPAIDGLAACWGISIIHCPYCHGYEVRNAKTGILCNGDTGFDFTRLIANWTKDLTVFTNGRSLFSGFQKAALQQHHIKIMETKIAMIEHNNGHIENIIFTDGTKSSIEALYAPAPFEQHCTIPVLLGCELTEDGYIETDALQQTTVTGVYACGDNAARMRTVANAVGMGTTAGISVSKKLIFDEF